MTHQPDISEDAVLKATGRSWREWLDLLNAAEMAGKTREEIIVFLREDHGVPSWWQQSIATAFEQSIGRTFESETDDGFQANLLFPLALSVETVFQAWIDVELRAKWLRHGDFEPSTVRAPDTVRGKWLPDGSWVDVNVIEDGEGKCELNIVHRKLASAAVVERMRQFWERSVDRMVDRVGSPR